MFKAVVEKTLTLGGELFITADHGNCEQMRNRDGSPNTAHTTYLVHVIYVAERAGNFKVDSGILAEWLRLCSSCLVSRNLLR